MVVFALLFLLTSSTFGEAKAFSTSVNGVSYIVTGITIDTPSNGRYETETYTNPNMDFLEARIRAWSNGTLQTSDMNSCTSGNCGNSGIADVPTLLPPVYYTARHRLTESGRGSRFYTSVGGGQSTETCWAGGC